MLTFKQLEAIYWVVQLGGFSPAAQKLHTTQSAVSKRVQELELLFETPLFDRSLRTARLTEKGEEMFLLAKQLLEQRDAAIDQFSSGAVVERRIRIGVTELTALTWLPRLVNAINTVYPKAVVEPDVDLSVSLRDKLLADEIDLMIAPRTVNDTRFSSVAVGKVENVWLAKPGTIKSSKPLTLHELMAHRLLTQGDKSGTGLLYEQWFKELGIKPSNTLTSNSLTALIGFTLSGLGVSYLPLKCMEAMIQTDKLEVVKVTQPLPKSEYLAMYKGDHQRTTVRAIVQLARESCDFTKMFDTPTTRP